MIRTISEEHLARLQEGREKAKLLGKKGDVVITNPLLQAKAAPASKVKAIRAMCASCMGCTESYQEPGWKQQVADCSAFNCPLHSHRPYRAKKEEVK